MKKKALSILLYHKVSGLVLIVVLTGLLSTIPLSINKTLRDVMIDLLFHIRGARQLSEDIVFVYIGAEDVQDLGGWPITRDYYGYVTYILNRLGARVITFDLLFEKPDPQYVEFDRRFAELMAAAGNVCLPMVFSELSFPDNHETRAFLPTGKHPVYPFDALKRAAAGIGFSNFGKQGIIRSVPLAVQVNGDTLLSLGARMAYLFLEGKESTGTSAGGLRRSGRESTMFIPIQEQGQLRLNHFGKLPQVTNIGFVDLLQTFDRDPDSLNFRGKLVIVSATSPGVPILRSTPLADNLPATLIHATVAENLIHGNYLRELPGYTTWIAILLLVLLAASAGKLPPWKWRAIYAGAVIFLYWAVVVMLFTHLYRVLPLFYPTLAYGVTHLYLFARRQYYQTSRQVSLKNLLQEEVRKKEAEFSAAKGQLEEVQAQLREESAVSMQLHTLALQRQHTILQLENELRDLKSYIIPAQHHSLEDFSEIVHAPESAMAGVLELVNRIRSDDIPVLIIGETGTGKEMVARAIHRTSRRKDKPFVAVNCGALPETLLESELFGHEKGSFTGAQARRKGRFELADGGTIFLDEITETTPAFQARLLRVLQESTFERLGGEQTIKVNVRIIAACNRDLQAEMNQGNFRADLFYRLNGFPMTLPPLRERLRDIPLLVVHFLKKHHYLEVEQLSDQVVATLQGYRWPGNVRELENAVRRAAIMARSEGRTLIQVRDLPVEIVQQQTATTEIYKPLEEQILESLRTLRFSHAAISQTARALGNRDRGTITEYFRGICFEELVKAEFNIEKAAAGIADSQEEVLLERIKKKVENYLNNLYPLPEIDLSKTLLDPEQVNLSDIPQFKGLPKKYHPALLTIIARLSDQPQSDS